MVVAESIPLLIIFVVGNRPLNRIWIVIEDYPSIA
jgi:hypothetical protein